MSKQILFIFVTVQFSLLLLYFGYQQPQPHLYAQTIPSVTPTGSVATATPPSEPTSTETSGGTNPPPAITNTPKPGVTATPSATLLFAPTPENGFLPTAAPCADSPTIQAFNTLNVRRGPGINYQVIDQLVFLEVRPIIGRSQYGKWWLIELANGDSGWVANVTGLAQGYIGNVPIVPAPPINGQTATPGVLWQPTPRSFCTVTPTHTATATPSATATPTAVPPTNTATVTSTPATNNEADAATSIALTAVAAEPTSTQLPTVYPPRPTATPLDIVAPASTPNFLPIVGLILVAGGIFLALARRRVSK